MLNALKIFEVQAGGSSQPCQVFLMLGLVLAVGRSLLALVKQLHQWLMCLTPDKQTVGISLPPGLKVTFTRDRKYMSKIMKKARKGRRGYRRFNPLDAWH